MRIRLATPDDALAIATVHVRTWQDAYRGHMPDAFLDGLAPERRLPLWERLLDAPGAPRATFVAEDGDRIVGFVSVGPVDPETGGTTTGELSSIYVLPDFQGNGAGRMLMDRACDSLRASGCTEALLWVLAGNVPAIAFYERLGWQETGETKQETIAGTVIEERRYRRLLV